MVVKSLSSFFHAINRFIHSPIKVLYLCFGLTFFSLIVDGTLYRLWGLHRKINTTESNTSKLGAESLMIQNKISQAKLPAFIENEARRRFEFAGKGELVFVFSKSYEKSPSE